MCRQLAQQLEAALGEAAGLLVEVAAELCDTDAVLDGDSGSAENSGSAALGTPADVPAKGAEQQAPKGKQMRAVTLPGSGTLAALPGGAGAAQAAQQLMGRASALDSQVGSMHKLLPQATLVSSDLHLLSSHCAVTAQLASRAEQSRAEK